VVAIAVVGLGLIVVIATLPGAALRAAGSRAPAVTAVLPLAVVFAFAFRFLPRSRPRWWDAIVPAAWVGLGASVLTVAFTHLAPIVFGAADLYGAFAGIFLGLLWLSYVTSFPRGRGMGGRARRRTISPGGFRSDGRSGRSLTARVHS